MRIIFLDIDGVLNSKCWLHDQWRNTGDDWPDGHIDPEAVAVLNEVIRRSGAEVVLSSSWRMIIELEDLEDVLRAKGYTGPNFLGKTPNHAQRPLYSGDDEWEKRGWEIHEWIGHYQGLTRELIDAFVIIDDSDDMAHLKPWLVRTKFDTGLLPEHVEPILKMLGISVKES